MIKFLIKGVVRDPSRFLFPILTVTIGVLLTVFLQGWIGGLMADFIDSSARFSTGHVRIITKSYAEYEDQMPNDLALIGSGALLEDLRHRYAGMDWVQRIHFGGLLDIPDENGETRAQGPTVGLAVDFLSTNGTSETSRLQLERALVRGRMPARSGEMLISDEFAHKLDVSPGQATTVLSATMGGSMAMQNFVIVGTLRFGLPPMDKSAVIIDLADAQSALDMHDAASEILGYFPDHRYDDLAATDLANTFNASVQNPADDFAAQMMTLRQQKGLDEYLQMTDSFSSILVSIFIIAMSIVLWNAGLLGGLRRYGEVGVRLAIGEYRGHIYRSMLFESILIGLAGSLLGTALGLGILYYLSVYGFDMSAFMQNSNLMFSTVVRPRITAHSWYIGFIPGLFATVLGTLLAGIGIYRRNTAQLFRELEA